MEVTLSGTLEQAGEKLKGQYLLKINFNQSDLKNTWMIARPEIILKSFSTGYQRSTSLARLFHFLFYLILKLFLAFANIVASGWSKENGRQRLEGAIPLKLLQI